MTFSVCWLLDRSCFISLAFDFWHVCFGIRYLAFVFWHLPFGIRCLFQKAFRQHLYGNVLASL